MDKICDYCKCQYDDSLDNCPHCGAANSFVRRGIGVPRTIDELKSWYKEKNLPPEETTRFFIGSDYKEPKAFGIYRDADGDFVVYKNKANGQRAVRYKGGDESYAVNEIYLKLKEEISRNKAHNSSGGLPDGDDSFSRMSNAVRGYNNNGGKKKRIRIPKKLLYIIVIIILYLLVLLVGTLFDGDKNKNAETTTSSSYSAGVYYNDYGWVDDLDDYDENHRSSDSGNSDWDDDWDSGWDSGDSWDSGGGDWDSDW